MWVWSDTEGTAALTIDIPCTVINDGKIIGCGGRGGSGLRIKEDHIHQLLVHIMLVTLQAH